MGRVVDSLTLVLLSWSFGNGTLVIGQSALLYGAGALVLAAAVALLCYRARMQQIRRNEIRFARLAEQHATELKESQSKFENLFAETPLPLFLYDRVSLDYL